MLTILGTLAALFTFLTFSLCRIAARSDAARARMVTPVPYHEYEDTDVYVSERILCQ